MVIHPLITQQIATAHQQGLLIAAQRSRLTRAGAATRSAGRRRARRRDTRRPARSPRRTEAGCAAR